MSIITTWWQKLRGTNAAALAGNTAELSFNQEVERIRKLPEAYQQRFDNIAAAAPTALFGRQELLDKFNDAVAAWQAGAPARILIEGEPGIGKTSMMDAARDALPAEIKCHELTINQTITSVDRLQRLFIDVLAIKLPEHIDKPPLNLIEKRLNQDPPKLIIINQAHNLFRRSVNGFDALEAFLNLILMTSPHVCWLIGFDTYSYSLIDRLFDVNDNFTHRLTLGPLTESQLQALLEHRHAGSDIDLTYLNKTQAALLASGDTDTPLEIPDQDTARASYFSNLAMISGGNPSAALFYWLSSLHQVADGEATHFYVCRAEPIMVKLLRTLDFELLAILASVLVQGELTTADLSETFGWNANRTQTLCRFLERRGLLRKINHHQFGINPILLQPIVAELKRKHLVH